MNKRRFSRSTLALRKSDSGACLKARFGARKPASSSQTSTSWSVCSKSTSSPSMLTRVFRKSRARLPARNCGRVSARCLEVDDFTGSSLVDTVTCIFLIDKLQSSGCTLIARVLPSLAEAAQNFPETPSSRWKAAGRHALIESIRAGVCLRTSRNRLSRSR